ncbi:4Fe-4S binding protein [bacterium]|nr:4Fe-4S binding protein [bacterium]
MENRILICMGTSGLSAGAVDVEKNFRAALKEKGLENSWEVMRVGDRGLFRDVLVDIITPALGRITYQYVKPEDVEKIVEDHLINGKPYKKRQTGESYEQFFKDQTRIVLANCGEIDPMDMDQYIETGGYKGLEKTMSMSREEVLEEITKSGLRGRGGGGFPTGTKWKFCKNVESDKKYIVCNADEGDPGAFMDRSVLEGDPHAVLEGMAIAGYTVGADEGYIYCRAEYPLAIKTLTFAIEEAEKRNYLGKNILGSDFSFTLHIKEGAGAFVCGEETALIASIEGKKGRPNPRPPYPAVEGLWGKPTIINNVETLANVRHIITRGSEWFSSIGYKDSKGTKVFALAGKIKNTGLVEVPMGTTIRDLVFGPGGGMLKKKIKFKGVQLGGPSGGCLPESLLDTPIDYTSITETGAIMGSGGMIVMDEGTCMVDVARYFLEFTVAESCGKCVPCRVGLKRMQEVLEDICAGRGKEEHLEFLQSMGETIKNTALCGLGNTAPNPVLTTMRYFMEEYEEHIKDKECRAHECVELIHFEVMEEKCVKCGACYRACPTDAIEWKKGEYAFIDKEKCIKCKSCINACDFMAIK